MIFFWILVLLLIFYALARVCDEYFIHSLEIIIKKLKLTPDVTGATFMAIGSSAPELFTSLIALTSINTQNIGAGTIVGSAIFNVLVIVGASALVATVVLEWKSVFRDIIFYLFSVGLLLFTLQDGKVELNETFIFLGLYVGYLVLLKFWTQIIHTKISTKIKNKIRIEQQEIINTVEDQIYEIKKARREERNFLKFITLGIDRVISWCFPRLSKHPERYMMTFVISILFIAVLSWGLVESAVELAHLLNVPDVIVALTILAGGTSIPDLLSSVIVSKRGNGGMAVSNAIGSNTFDILIGLGVPWMIFILIRGESIDVCTDNLWNSTLLLFSTVIVLLLLLVSQKLKIGKKSGMFLLLIYVAYLMYDIAHALAWLI